VFVQLALVGFCHAQYSDISTNSWLLHANRG
jgi:hypothetical protein